MMKMMPGNAKLASFSAPAAARRQSVSLSLPVDWVAHFKIICKFFHRLIFVFLSLAAEGDSWHIFLPVGAFPAPSSSLSLSFTGSISFPISGR